jgi:ABC-type tungstate transport system permease subunit
MATELSGDRRVRFSACGTGSSQLALGLEPVVDIVAVHAATREIQGVSQASDFTAVDACSAFAG